MISLKHNLPAYLQIVSMWLQTFYTYRFNLAVELATLLVEIFLLKVVWTAVYAGRPSVAQIDLSSLIAYLTLVNLQFWFLPNLLASYIPDRVRQGLVAFDLARPVSYSSQMLANQAGSTLGTLLNLMVVFPLAILVGGIAPPTSLRAVIFYLVSTVLAYLISALIGLLLGMVAFWTLETEGFLAIYYFVNRFFAGTLVPLWFFPPVLRTAASLLPFQALAFVPVAIYLGKLDGADLLRALALQLFWVVALSVVARIAWARAVRRVVVQGG